MGQFQEAADICRAGLATHHGYLSARVTLGRALIELNQPDEAQVEFELVLKSAPENLAAIRGLAEIHHGRGHLAEALTQYRAALGLAHNDPDLERTVNELARQVQPAKAAPFVTDGLSLEQMQHELLSHVPSPTASLALPRREAVPPTPTRAPSEPQEDVGAAQQRVWALEHFLAAIHVARASRRA